MFFYFNPPKNFWVMQAWVPLFKLKSLWIIFPLSTLRLVKSRQFSKRRMRWGFGGVGQGSPDWQDGGWTTCLCLRWACLECSNDLWKGLANFYPTPSCSFHQADQGLKKFSRLLQMLIFRGLYQIGNCAAFIQSFALSPILRPSSQVSSSMP